MKNVARRIKSIREFKRISQDELADSLHLTKEQLISYEDGEEKLSPEMILEFATALEVQESFLRFGDSQNNSTNINGSNIDGSNVTTNSSTTNNYYRQGDSDQLDRIEQKLDYLLQRYPNSTK